MFTWCHIWGYSDNRNGSVETRRRLVAGSEVFDVGDTVAVGAVLVAECSTVMKKVKVAIANCNGRSNCSSRHSSRINSIH
jgi:hypothetical protein